MGDYSTNWYLSLVHLWVNGSGYLDEAESIFIKYNSCDFKIVLKHLMTETKSLHLAFIYHVPFWEENNQIWTTYSPIGRYVDSLSHHFAHITIISPTRSVSHHALYQLNASNISIKRISAFPNIQSYYFQLPYFYFRLFREIKKCDIVSIRMPVLTGFPAYLAARWYRKPLFLVIVGENFQFVKLAGYSRLKSTIANLTAKLQDVLMKQAIKNSLTFTNGEELLAKFKHLSHNVCLMRSSTISQADILTVFRDTCNNKTNRILTVASVTPRKGTSLIPEAIKILSDKGFQVEWKYIGRIEGQSGEQELAKTLNIASQLDVSSMLSFQGPTGFSDLMPIYRESDIFVLPTYAEGIPRVILEAQASGVPVITTGVGGIPQAVSNGNDALLIPPGDSLAMAETIEKVITDYELRQTLIKNGLNTAEKFTLESETALMIKKVNEVLLKG